MRKILFAAALAALSVSQAACLTAAGRAAVTLPKMEMRPVAAKSCAASVATAIDPIIGAAAMTADQLKALYPAMYAMCEDAQRAGAVGVDLETLRSAIPTLPLR